MRLYTAKQLGLAVCGALIFTACDLSVLFDKEKKSSEVAFQEILASSKP